MINPAQLSLAILRALGIDAEGQRIESATIELLPGQLPRLTLRHIVIGFDDTAVVPYQLVPVAEPWPWPTSKNVH